MCLSIAFLIIRWAPIISSTVVDLWCHIFSIIIIIIIIIGISSGSMAKVLK